MLDWPAVVGLCALFSLAFSLIGAAVYHVYRRGSYDTKTMVRSETAESVANVAIAKIELMGVQLHDHEVKDAAAFAELRALVTSSISMQSSIENRFAKAIEDLSKSLADLGKDLRTSMGDISRRIDGALERR
jgi:hypothetical protein